MSAIHACIPSIGKSPWLSALIERLIDDDVDVRVYVNSERPFELDIDPRLMWGMQHLPGLSIYEEWNRAAQAAKTTEADYLILCNDDIEIYPGTARALADALDANPQFGAMSVGETHFGVAPGQVTAVSHQIGNRRSFLQWCFMVRVSMWQDVDPRYRIWYGDDDLIWKMNAAGHLVGVLQGVGAVHYTSTTISQTPWVNEAAGQDGLIWAQEH